MELLVWIDHRRNYLHFPIKNHHYFLSNITFYDSLLKISEKYAFTSLRDLYAQFYGFIRFMLLLSIGIFYSPQADRVELSSFARFWSSCKQIVFYLCKKWQSMISVILKRGCLNEKWCISHFCLTTDIGQDNVRPVRPPTDFCDEREIPMKFSPIQSITFSQLFLRG